MTLLKLTQLERKMIKMNFMTIYLDIRTPYKVMTTIGLIPDFRIGVSDYVERVR